MKGLAVLVVAVLMLACAAGASQDSWRVNIYADDGTGGFASSNNAQAGVYPTASDGYSSSPSEEGSAPYTGLVVDITGTYMHLAFVVPGESDLYNKNIIAPTAPPRAWDMYVAANVNSTAGFIRPMVRTAGSTALPTPTFDGTPVRYALVLLDNKGMAGAPASGTRWELPIPTVHSTAPYWTCPVNLPAIKLSGTTNAALIDEGYKLQLVQEAVPEPSSILALGSGMLGLAGYALRRRKA